MSELDLGQLSSNWKKLREKLQSEKKDQPSGNGLKRKRPENRTKVATGFKKTKLSDGQLQRASNGQKMGANGSKEVSARAQLSKEHDISRKDISAAYGSTNETAQYSTDEINGGIHPFHKVGKYVALDCEMVGTGPPPYLDNVLARASLVNFHGEQIYDSYVLPPPRIDIKDYRTHVSGITPGHLVEGYARPFAEVVKDVANLLDTRILVGHALQNDLQALLLSHAKRDLRDTSRHPKFRVESKGRPPALRNLVKAELGMKIQAGEHSSVEDARAAMMLFRKEKAGFEEDNRKRFGHHTKLESVKSKDKNHVAKSNSAADEDGEDYDEEADLQLLEGEEDIEADIEEPVSGKKPPVPNARRKTKNKKRTKRK